MRRPGRARRSRASCRACTAPPRCPRSQDRGGWRRPGPPSPPACRTAVWRSGPAWSRSPGRRCPGSRPVPETAHRRRAAECRPVTWPGSPRYSCRGRGFPTWDPPGCSLVGRRVSRVGPFRRGRGRPRSGTQQCPRRPTARIPRAFRRTRDPAGRCARSLVLHGSRRVSGAPPGGLGRRSGRPSS